MGELLKISMTRKELDNGIIPQNYVMVEAELTAEGKKTKGGIIFGHHEDVVYDDETTSWEADIAQVAAKVYKLPERLYYDEDNPNHSLPWLPDMELGVDLQVGDTVWTSPIESRNAITTVCEGKGYKLWPIQDLWVAKREIWLSKFNGKKKEEITVLNGMVIVEPVFEINDSPLAIEKKGAWDKTKGIVRFVGKPNRAYQNKSYVDFMDLRVGDTVLFNPGSPLVPLERQKYNAHFLNDELFFVTQRRRIAMVIERK